MALPCISPIAGVPTASVMTDTECAGRSTVKLGPAVTSAAVTFTTSGLEKLLAACRDPAVSVSGQRVALIAGGPTTPTQVVSLDLSTRTVEVLRESDVVDFDAEYLSVP